MIGLRIVRDSRPDRPLRSAVRIDSRKINTLPRNEATRPSIEIEQPKPGSNPISLCVCRNQLNQSASLCRSKTARPTLTTCRGCLLSAPLSPNPKSSSARCDDPYKDGHHIPEPFSILFVERIERVDFEAAPGTRPGHQESIYVHHNLKSWELVDRTLGGHPGPANSGGEHAQATLDFAKSHTITKTP